MNEMLFLPKYKKRTCFYIKIRFLEACILFFEFSCNFRLLPHGQLDPPLWSQKGIGRIFPWPAKSRRRVGGLPSVLENNDEMPIDYVFRVVNKSNPEEFCEFSKLY
jgi:hypothetical protein